MSMTHHAAAIVGCKVDETKIFFKDSVRSCEHQLPLDHNAIFCPACGRKLWKQKDVTIPQYDYHDGSISGFRVIRDYYEDVAYIAGELTEIDNCERIPQLGINTDDCNAIRSRLKLTLEPLGLWNEKEFGIWVAAWAV